MNKHALMLTVATIALTAGHAYADTTITTKKTAEQKTSETGNLLIDTGGSVVVTSANPAILIDSANTVKLNVSTVTVSNLNTDSAIGVELDATGAGNGPTASGALALDSYGSIDLTGTGAGKTGILIKAAEGTGNDIFNGGITLETGSALGVKGDGSYGIESQTGTTLKGNVTILGSLTVGPTTVGSTSSTAGYGMLLNGNLDGNLVIGQGGVVQVVGEGANGIYTTGAISGSFTNSGSLTVAGTSTPKTTGGNPQGGTALTIMNSVGGGILNDGPSSTDSTATTGIISVAGTGDAVVISPGSSGTAITIGQYSDTTDPGFSFLNRGSMSAQSVDYDHSAVAVSLSGAAAAPTTFTGGFYNSGTIAATSASDTKATTPLSAVALNIGSYVNIAQTSYNGLGSYSIVNSNEVSTGGTIRATLSGTAGGTATAIAIGTGSNVPSLINQGTIAASASTTDTTISTLHAYGIYDSSGSLKTIFNSGTISATATTLDNDSQIAVAANLSTSSQDITFTNQGTVAGGIVFGSGADTLSVNAPTASATASVTGDIAFGGTLGHAGANDQLIIGTNNPGTVSGAITEINGGKVDVTIGGAGSLTLKNTAKTLDAGTLQVNNGGILNISLSNGFNQTADPSNPALVTADTVNFAQTAKLNVSFGSFIATPGGQPATFTLFNTTGGVVLADPASITTTIEQSVPYLFTGTVSQTTDSLSLELQPKTADQIGLTGNANTIFDYANAALATDDALGAAVVTNVSDQATAQAAYASFVPDLSGSTRAVAVSLTDQATGPVGARQRALRMYAARPGGTTMWGQEFVQRLTSGNDADGYRASGFGFALGFDSGGPDTGRYGMALTFFSGDQTNKGPNFSKTTNEWYMLTGYTDWRGKGLFLDTQLSVAYGNLNGNRHLNLTDPTSGDVVFQRNAHSKRAGLLAAGGVSTGAIFTYGSTVLMPQVSLDGLTMREEGYTETGGGDGLDLHVDPYYASSVRGYVGGTVRQDIDFGGWYVQPEARIGYRYDFLSDAVKLKASFASVGDQFTLIGPDPERGNAVAGASVAVTTGAWSLGINYDYLRGNGGAVNQTGTITLIGRI